MTRYDVERGAQSRIASGAHESVAVGRLQHLGGTALVDDLEMRGEACLDRKAPEQRFTERMDRLDLEPSGHVQYAREQAPRLCHPLRLGSGTRQRLQRRVQRLVGAGGPLAECSVHAVRHLRGCGPGKGQAQDVLRRCAVQKQREHAIRQHFCLAAAGGGRDPDAGPGVGGGALIRRRVGHREGSAGHGSPPPPADHSKVRARWSKSLYGAG